MDQSARRAALRTALATALGPSVPVLDETTAEVVSHERFVVVRWERSTSNREQTVHTYAIDCVATDADRYATRDQIVNTVMVTTNQLQAFGRPDATIAAVAVGETVYERMATVTVTATDDPISS